MRIKTIVFSILLAITVPAPVARGVESFYTVRMEDFDAAYLNRDDFPVHGNGIGDNSAALQTAIDCTFEGQSKAVLKVEQSGLAMVRPRIKNVPELT